MRKNLVIVRAGDKSLHQRWVGEDRTWDLFVSAYGSSPRKYKDDGEYFHAKPGGCWSGNAAAVDMLGDLVNGYEFVAFPNDDLQATTRQWNRLFEECSNHGLDFAHPSLLRNCVGSLRPQTGVRIRIVARLPDVNCPVLSQAVLPKVRHTFGESEIGLGLMWVWPHLCPGSKTAVVDSVVFDHTRALGTGDRVIFEKNTGIDGNKELLEMASRYGLTV